MIEELGIRLRSDGVAEATNGMALTGKAVEDLGRKADRASDSIARTGKTSKETAAAMRLLPAQITDITTSLASGQAAWLVAIQQGGQIKDSFGGVGPTMTALRGAIAPTTLAIGGAAAAAGVLVAAWELGAREARGYTQAIVLTGNAAGVTTSQMGDMARAVGDVVGTQRQAADALTQLVASGQVGGRGLEQFAETAVRMERTVGQSVETTVKTFADLGRAPLAASVRLNETTNYLTVAIYSQIKALVEQKKMSEAAALAQQAYANAMAPRLAELEGNVGLLQRAWRGLGDVAAWTWDKMLGVGREGTLSERIRDAQAELAKVGTSRADQLDPAGQDKRRAAILERISALQELQRTESRAAAIRATEAAAVKDSIAADTDKKKAIDEGAAAYASLADQIARRMSLAQAELANEGKLTDAERFRVDMLREIDEAQKKIGTSRAAALRLQVDTTARTLEALDLQRNAAKEQEEIHRRYLADRQQATQAAERDVAQLQQQLAALQGETAELGLNSDALYNRKQALLDDAIAERQAHLARIEGLADYTEQATAIQQQIGLLQDLKAARAENFIKAYKADEDKANQQRTEAIAQSIEDGILEGFRGGGRVADVFLRELKAQFLNTVLKVPIQLLANSGGDLLSKLGQFLPMLMSAGGTSFSGAGMAAPIGASTVGMFLHGGGIAGSEASFTRSLPAATWSRAPRFHGGVGPDELPAVLTKKEGVFTEGQMKAMAPVSALAAARGNTVYLTFAPHIDARTDKAEIMGLIDRAGRAMQADLLDKMNRGQV